MHVKMLRESEVELSVQALQIAEIPRMFNRRITSIAFRIKIPKKQDTSRPKIQLILVS